MRYTCIEFLFQNASVIFVLRCTFLYVICHFQMVDRLDEGAISADIGPLDYKGLYKAIYGAYFFSFLSDDFMYIPFLDLFHFLSGCR